jgi:hypothetical protein
MGRSSFNLPYVQSPIFPKSAGRCLYSEAGGEMSDNDAALILGLTIFSMFGIVIAWVLYASKGNEYDD